MTLGLLELGVHEDQLLNDLNSLTCHPIPLSEHVWQLVLLTGDLKAEPVVDQVVEAYQLLDEHVVPDGGLHDQVWEELVEHVLLVLQVTKLESPQGLSMIGLSSPRASAS